MQEQAIKYVRCLTTLSTD